MKSDPETMQRSAPPRPGGQDDTPDAHLERITSYLRAELGAKYRAGQKEHGGCLSRKPVVHEIGAEVLDLVVYYYTMREQAHRLTELLASAVASRNWTDVQRALNLSIVGNEEGKRP